MSFKVGDKVLCVEDRGYNKQIKNGSVYTVTRVDGKGHIGIGIKIHQNSFSEDFGFKEERFILATELIQELS